MFTKIIKQGAKLGKIRFECDLCGCVFEKSARRCTEVCGYFTVRCPNCGKAYHRKVSEVYEQEKKRRKMSNDRKNQYISRAKLLRIINDMIEDLPGMDSHCNLGWVSACKSLRELMKPEIFDDVAPTVHAKWEIKPVSGEIKAVCTNCGKTNKQYTPPYCPHCGAKMEEKS